MLSVGILKGIADVVLEVFPNHIRGIQQLELKLADQIKVADTINIHLCIQNRNVEPRATTIITTHAPPEQASGALGVIVSMPEALSSAALARSRRSLAAAPTLSSTSHPGGNQQRCW